MIIEWKKISIDKYEKRARIIDLAAEYCIVKSTVSTIMKKEAIRGADVVIGVKKQAMLEWKNCYHEKFTLKFL